MAGREETVEPPRSGAFAGCFARDSFPTHNNEPSAAKTQTRNKTLRFRMASFIRAASRFSGRKRPVVILDHPQCRHKLQRPADHPAISVVVPTTFPWIITRSPEPFVNVFSFRRRFLCTSDHTFIAPSTSTAA